MESLRSRPSQAPGTGTRTTTKLSKNNQNARRDPGKGKIDDKIKKRMSARYADISSPTDLSGLPPMPSIVGLVPGAQRGADAPVREDEDLRDRTGAQQDARVVADDKKLLSAEDFDPAAFLKLKLANSTEAELRSLQSSLRKAVEDTSSELQRSVFKNYAEFVLISKEISVLENEMLELKDLLSEYKSMPSTLNIPDPTAASSSLLSTYKRSSVADLRVLYSNQMHNLHSQIEGASKFVPITPGRHVVGEMEGIYSLNAATYKVTGKVKFVILDDAVLVAKRRRRAAGGPSADGGSTVNEGKLVAERCWPLNEMLVLDTKDSATMTNVFKIRHGKETHVYRTEVVGDKKSLLAQFRQVAEELSQKRRREREGEHERRKSMWQGGNTGRNSPIPPVPDWMSDLAKRGGDIPGFATDAKEKAERDTRWIGDWSDELTIAISLKEWEKAVQLVEKGQAKAGIMPQLAAKLPALTNQLVSSLLSALSLPSNKRSTVVTFITLLNRLKAGAAARRTFLDMRTGVIKGLVRKIPFEGHVETYIGELSIVYFTGIKHTADWYLASFKENEVASSFIAWTKQQIESFAEIFRCQVYTTDVDPSVVQESIQITLSSSRKLLQEFGLDFRYLFDELLVEHPKEKPTRASFAIQAPSPGSPTDVISPPPRVETPSTSQELMAAPPPPLLSAAPPPVNRRRTPNPPLPTPPSSFTAGSSPDAGSYSSSLRSSAGLTPGSAYPAASSLSPMPSSPLRSPRPLPNAPVPQPSRSRTPVSQRNAASSSTSVTGSPTPAPAVPGNLASGSSLISPQPRSAGAYLPDDFGRRNRSGSVRDRDGGYSGVGGRSARASPVPSPVLPPPRSANRPGSAVGNRTPAAVAQREGMI